MEWKVNRSVFHHKIEIPFAPQVDLFTSRQILFVTRFSVSVRKDECRRTRHVVGGLERIMSNLSNSFSRRVVDVPDHSEAEVILRSGCPHSSNIAGTTLVPSPVGVVPTSSSAPFPRLPLSSWQPKISLTVIMWTFRIPSGYLIMDQP